MFTKFCHAAVFTVLIGGVFSTSTALSADKSPKDYLQFQSRTNLEASNRSGPGKASSFYDNGVHIYEELDTKLRQKLESGYNLSLDSTVRWAENRNVDPRPLSFENLALKVKNKKQEFALGDYFATLSPYVMNRSVKGVGYRRALGDDKNFFKVFAGNHQPSWEYLYADYKGEGMSRNSVGGRYQYSADALEIGLNTVSIFDDEDDEHRGTEDAYRNFVNSADWKYTTDDIRLDAEHAYSYARRLSTTSDNDHLIGTANKIRLRTRIFDIDTRLRLENVSPGFKTLGGGAAVDRRKKYAKFRKKFSKQWSGFFTYSSYFDKLPGSTATKRTFNDTYEIGATHRKAFERPSLRINMGLRHGRVTTDIKDRKVYSNRLKLGFSDRYFKKLRTRFNFQLIEDHDRISNTRSHNYLYDLNLSSRHRFGKKWILRPALYLARRESNDGVKDNDDKHHTVRLTANVTGPNKVRMGGSVELNDSNIYNGTDTNRRKLRLYAGYRPDWLPKSQIRVDAASNHFGTDAAGKRYNENVIKLSIVWDSKKMSIGE